MTDASAMNLPPSVTLADVEEAARNLEGVIRDLPLAGAQWLEQRVDGQVRLVTENLQRAGSFKIRGAYNRISRLSEEERERGVVAASAGNHAQGVAVAAQLLGVRATVFMPEGATIPKVAATLGYGADVRFHGDSLDRALEAAQEFARETGAVLIHPFDHPDVIAGQGTLGLEIMAKMPDVRTVVVCTGGGGLLAGVALAVKSIDPTVRVVGRAGRAGRGLPAVAGGRRAGPAGVHGDDGRRHRRRAPRRRAVRAGAAVRRRDHDGHRGGDRPRRAAAPRAGEAGGGAGGCGGRGGGAGPPACLRAAGGRRPLRRQRRLARSCSASSDSASLRRVDT